MLLFYNYLHQLILLQKKNSRNKHQLCYLIIKQWLSLDCVIFSKGDLLNVDKFLIFATVLSQFENYIYYHLECVVYFGQHLDAAHSKRWSKSSFLNVGQNKQHGCAILLIIIFKQLNISSEYKLFNMKPWSQTYKIIMSCPIMIFSEYNQTYRTPTSCYYICVS